jgi:uncharacterized membrane protein YeaQ/YmgE (transglycosylase-associated protein family)
VSLIAYLIWLAVIGLFVGAFARLALPGRDPMSIPMTILLGLAGSFIGGLVMYALTGGRHAGSFLVSLFFAVVILYFIRRSRGGSLMHPGYDARRGGGVFGPRRRF